MGKGKRREKENTCGTGVRQVMGYNKKRSGKNI